ncbi:MAG: hypothetical protein NTY51_13210 [Deltaproteobacteria bacterium]|nr:hypothetical protein [Deltaproteobacteria bacterium]
MTTFLESLFSAFRDNAKMNHYAEYDGSRIYSTMPVTSFLYNFFIYNTIYQYDWETSIRLKTPIPWSVERESQVGGEAAEPSKSDSEFARQKRLEKFMRKACKRDRTILHSALLPLSRLSDLNGRWTSLFVSTSRTHREAVASFFTHLSELSRAIQAAQETGDGIFDATKQNFEMIQKCRYFVYTLRNDIISGSKTLGDVVDLNQEKRIAHYDLFIKSLLQLFFLCHEMGPLPEVAFRLSVREGRVPPPPAGSQVRFRSFVKDD